MNRTYIISALATLAIVLVGYFVLSGMEKPAAVVNGHAITEDEVQSALSSRSMVHQGTEADVSTDAMRSSVLEQLISEELLLQGAREAGVTVTDAEVNAELERLVVRGGGEEKFKEYLKEKSITREEYSERIREGLMKNKFTKEFITVEDVPEEKIIEFYKDSPVPFMEPESVELRIVELETREMAEATMKEIRSLGKGGFDKVADRLMEDKSAFVSKYGETNPDFYPGEVGRAMKDLPEGQYGGPYEGKEGFFLVRVKQRTPERPRTFEEARGEISAMLQERRKSAAMIHWIADKRNSSTIVRN